MTNSRLLRVRRGADLIARVTPEQLREGVAAGIYKAGDEVQVPNSGPWRDLEDHLREAVAPAARLAPPVTGRKQGNTGGHPLPGEGAKGDDGWEAPPKPLYPPALVGTLGLVFSPALGAFLAGRNWEALGDAAAARRQFRWMVASLVCVAGVVLTTLAASTLFETIFHLVFLALIIGWFLEHRRQTAHVKLRAKARGGTTHPRRSVVIPVLVATLVTAGVFTVLARSAFQRAERMVREMGLEMPSDVQPDDER